MVVRNPELASFEDFVWLKRDTSSHLCIWFKFRMIVIGGLYLPPNTDENTCVECIEFANVESSSDSLYVVGDLNMRFRSRIVDSHTNYKSCLHFTSRIMNLRWARPNQGKWTGLYVERLLHCGLYTYELRCDTAGCAYKAIMKRWVLQSSLLSSILLNVLFTDNLPKLLLKYDSGYSWLNISSLTFANSQN